MTTCPGKSFSFGLPRVPFVNCCQYMYLVISLLVLRAGCGIFAYLFTFSKSLSCKPLSAQVRLQPGSICLDMFVNGLAVTWPVTVVSQGIVPVYRTDTCTGFPPPQQPSLLLHLGKRGFG